MINRITNYLSSKISSPFVKDRWPLLVLIAVIILFPLASQSYFLTRLGVILALNATIITGMTLLTRYTGIVSLGHSAFLAIGAYISGVLTVSLKINPWLAMAVAAVFTVLAAYLFCAPFLKLRTIYLAMATLGLGEVVYILIKSLDTITGGVIGLSEIPYLSIGPLVLRKDWQIFYLVGFFIVFFAFLADNIGRTRLGRAYHAIRTNETAALASGINAKQNMRDIFCFSALSCSLAGSLMAHFITFISPNLFTTDLSFNLLIIVIIGGANVWAGILTTVILMGFFEVFRAFQDYSLGFTALLLVVAFFIFPDGLSSVLFPPIRAAKKMSKKHRETEQVTTKINKKQKTGRILEVNEISMKFGGTEALSKVSFSVDSGQITGIIGPNGAGKTTLLNIMNGFLKPLEGSVNFRDQNVINKAPYEMAKMGAGRTFQLINLFKGMTVIENVMVGCHLKGKSGILVSGLNLKRARDEEKKIWDASVNSLRLVGLMEKAYDIVESLSFGEQRLVELARALAMEPELIFLDEPASGLNTVETERLADILRGIRDQGITIMLVEHNMPLVMSVSDKVCVLDFGKLIACGTPEFVCKDEGVIKAYLGQEAQSAS